MNEISIKKYLNYRKQAGIIQNTKTSGEMILTTVKSLLNDNRTHKVQFFIKELQKVKKTLHEEIETNNISVSTELLKRINNQDIFDLHDCHQFGELFLEIYEENKLKIKPLFIPILHTKLNLLEVSMVGFILFLVYIVINLAL